MSPSADDPHQDDSSHPTPANVGFLQLFMDARSRLENTATSASPDEKSQGTRAGRGESTGNEIG